MSQSKPIKTPTSVLEIHGKIIKLFNWWFDGNDTQPSINSYDTKQPSSATKKALVCSVI